MVHHHGVIDRKTDLKLGELHVLYPGSKPYVLAHGVQVVPLTLFVKAK
jgi:hypothetical protein